MKMTRHIPHKIDASQRTKIQILSILTEYAFIMSMTGIAIIAAIIILGGQITSSLINI